MTLCNETTAQGDRPLGAVDGNMSRSVGDYMPRKRDGVFRLMSLNVGNFTAQDTESNKTRDLFSFIRANGVDACNLCEHGLNPRKVSPANSWWSRTMGQFQELRTRLSWNRNWDTDSTRMWGGTGMIVQGQNCRRYINFEEDDLDCKVYIFYELMSHCFKNIFKITLNLIEF